MKRFNENWDGVSRNITEAPAANAGLKVGDIFHASWGYEQTNATFFKVTKVIGTKTVELQELDTIKATYNANTMTGTAVPGKKLVGPPLRKQVSPSVVDGKPRVKINDYMAASLWDGKPKQFSSYA